MISPWSIELDKNKIISINSLLEVILSKDQDPLISLYLCMCDSNCEQQTEKYFHIEDCLDTSALKHESKNLELVITIINNIDIINVDYHILIVFLILLLITLRKNLDKFMCPHSSLMSLAD